MSLFTPTYFASISIILVMIASFQSLHDITEFERHKAKMTYLSAIYFILFAMFVQMTNAKSP
mgnify:CR=1 FL=1